MLTTEEKKDEKNQVDKTAVPTSTPAPKTDPILNQLKLPSRYFAHEIGVEDIPDSQTTQNSRFQFPPEVKEQEKVAKETNQYKILDEKNECASSFLLKGEKEYIITLDEPQGNSLISNISDTIAYCLDLAKKQNQPLPTNNITFLEAGLIKYVAKDELGVLNTYLVSPRLLLEKDTKQSIPKDITQQLEDTNKAIEELKKEVGSSNLRELKKAVTKLLKKEEELEGKALPIKDESSYLLEFARPEDDREYKAVNREIHQLKRKIQSLDKILSLEKHIVGLKTDVASIESFHGQLIGGEKVHAALTNTKNKKLSIYNESNGKIMEIADGHTTMDTPHGRQRLYYLLDLRNETTIKEYFIGSSPENCLERQYISRDNEITLKEKYDGKGHPTKRENLALGIVETYEQGELLSRKVIDGKRFFDNIIIARDIDGFTRLLMEAAVGHPMDLLLNCHNIEQPNILDLAENAISKMEFEEIESSKNELEMTLSRLDIPEGGINLKEKNIITEVLDRLDFRINMITEGKELTRADSHTEEVRTTSIWNNPKLEHYFSVKDEWINWETKPAKEMLNITNVDLSKKETKLLISEYIQDKQLPMNPESVETALNAISKLRNEYQNLELIEKRNVVLATHSDTLVDLESYLKYKYLESSNDHHQFGKHDLLEDLRSKVGAEGSFSLLRTEFDDLPSSDEILRILTQVKIPENVSKEILQALNSPPLFGKQTPSLIHLTKILQDLEYVHKIPQIVELIRGTESERLVSLKQLKQNILEAIKGTPPPFTFIFEGHGGPEFLYLSNGNIGENNTPVEFENTIKISVQEFANAINQRSENFGIQDKDNRTVIILQNCYSSNIIGKLSTAISPEHMPIILGSSEFNQFSLFNHAYEYGSSYLSKIIGIENGFNANLKEAIKRQFNNQIIDYKIDVNGEERIFKSNMDTNPVFHVPDKDGNLIKISQNLMLNSNNIVS